MIKIDPLEQVKTRKEKVSKWRPRLDKLKRKKNMTEQEFCEKHNIRPDWLSRAKNQNPLPYDRKINQVEKALEDEGV